MTNDQAPFNDQEIAPGRRHRRQMLDEDYMEAMEYGMPPAAGFGFRALFAVLMDKSVRETVVFPPMKESPIESRIKSNDPNMESTAHNCCRANNKR